MPIDFWSVFPLLGVLPVSFAFAAIVFLATAPAKT
jgi:hypothetical protein